MLREWKVVRKHLQANDMRHGGDVSDVRSWKPLEFGSLKLNVDASFCLGAASFSIGMIIRNHEGVFIEGRSMTLLSPASVFEAECIGVREALSWLMSYQDRSVMVETDSLLTVQALLGSNRNLLEVGHVVDQCKMLIQGLPLVRVNHIRKQANKMAHSLDRIPYLLNCFIIFSSPPTHLVETLLNDFNR